MKRFLLAFGLVMAFAVPVAEAGAVTSAQPPVVTVEAPAGPPSGMTARQATTVKIHHYNICNGWSTRPDDACDKEQATNAEDLLVFLAAADGAWFISVNEICQNTFERLAKRLNSAGTMVINKVREGDCEGLGFGNAIFHPGGVRQDGTAWYFPTQDPDEGCADPAPDAECRTGLCLKLATFAGPMAQCTAHLDGGSTVRTTTQSAEFLWTARSWVEPGRRLSLAGDFNLIPVELHPAYDELVDLVLGPTYHAREELTGQIDYIFVERTGTWTGVDPFCTDLASQASDHCFTQGYWHL